MNGHRSCTHFVFLSHTFLESVAHTGTATLPLAGILDIPALGKATTASSSALLAVLDANGRIAPNDIPFLRARSRSSFAAGLVVLVVTVTALIKRIIHPLGWIGNHWKERSTIEMFVR